MEYFINYVGGTDSDTDTNSDTDSDYSDTDSDLVKGGDPIIKSNKKTQEDILSTIAMMDIPI